MMSISKLFSKREPSAANSAAVPTQMTLAEFFDLMRTAVQKFATEVAG
jgi:hypothetical protein